MDFRKFKTIIQIRLKQVKVRKYISINRDNNEEESIKDKEDLITSNSSIKIIV